MLKVYLEYSEVQKLEGAAKNLRDQLLIRMLFRLGCRVSEALGLEVKDVDLVSGTVRIQHLKARIKLACPHCSAQLGKSHSFCPKCGQKVSKAVEQMKEHRRMRTLPIDEDTQQLLKQYIKHGGPVKQKGKKLIFGISRNTAWRVVKRCSEKAGLPMLTNPESGKVHNVSPHRLRDAFAVHAVKTNDSGDGLRLLQEHLGHASFNTTAKYRKVAGEELKEWYSKLWDKGEVDA